MDSRDQQSIRCDLASADAEVRRLAVERVLMLPLREALPCLMERLGDDDWRVRKAAVGRLSTLPERAVVSEELVAALADAENTGRRNAAVEALVARGAAAVGALLRASASDDPDVRKLAVDALGRIGDPQSVEGLVLMLGDPDANLRAAVADALGATGSPAARTPLLALAGKAEEHLLVRLAALRALLALGAELRLMDLESALAQPLLEPVAYELLGRADEPVAWAILLEGVVSSSRSSREAAMRGLVAVLERAAPHEAEAVAERIRAAIVTSPDVLRDAGERLAEADLATRRVLMQVLGLAGAEASVVPILEAGGEEALTDLALSTLAQLGATAERALEAAFGRLAPEARTLACRVLGRMRGVHARGRLRAALQDPALEVRIAAAESLGEGDDEETLLALLDRLSAATRESGGDVDEELRAIGLALGRVAAAGDLGAHTVRWLTARLPAAEAGERAEIARILGSLGEPQGREPVTLLLSDPSSAVRRTAVESLARLDPTSESLRLALADDSPLVRVAAADCLVGFAASEVTEDLGCLSRDDDERVRAAAARAMASLAASDPPAEDRERLLELLCGSVFDAGAVAIAAVEGLAKLGSAEAVRKALPALAREDAEIVQAAVRGLGLHGDPDALQYLVPLVAHPHWLVRAEAIEALARRGVVRAVPAILRHLECESDEFVRSVILRALKRLED